VKAADRQAVLEADTYRHCMATPADELAEHLDEFGTEDAVVRLYRFLRARYDEGAAALETIRQGGYAHSRWTTEPSRSGSWINLVSLDRALGADDEPERREIGFLRAGRGEYVHVARWDPAAVIEDLAAKRALVDEVAGWRHERLYDRLEENTGPFPCSRRGNVCDPMHCGVRLRQLVVLRHLAAPFRTHPEWQEACAR